MFLRVKKFVLFENWRLSGQNLAVVLRGCWDEDKFEQVFWDVVGSLMACCLMVNLCRCVYVFLTEITVSADVLRR